MIDEHFIRQWTDGHDRFSADLDRGLARLRAIIDSAYGEQVQPKPGPARSEAIMAGLAATTMTVVLLATTAVLFATPGVVLA